MDDIKKLAEEVYNSLKDEECQVKNIMGEQWACLPYKPIYFDVIGAFYGESYVSPLIYNLEEKPDKPSKLPKNPSKFQEESFIEQMAYYIFQSPEERILFKTKGNLHEIPYNFIFMVIASEYRKRAAPALNTSRAIARLNDEQFVKPFGDRKRPIGTGNVGFEMYGKMYKVEGESSIKR